MELDYRSLDLLNAKGPAKLNQDEISLIGFYFSAHWCPPSRMFTPKLISAYNMINKTSKKLEIIFVSFDRDIESWEEYSETMPWLFIPYTNKEIKIKLAKFFQIQDTFRLIILTNLNVIITTNGIDDLKSQGVNCIDSWQQISSRVSHMHSPAVCENGHLMNFMNAPTNVSCKICNCDLLNGWNCSECNTFTCQSCQEWINGSTLVKEDKLLCLKSHKLRKTENINEYYLKRFLTDKYTCRTCNSYPTGRGYHCRACIFDICEECGEIIVSYDPKEKCINGHPLVWSHDLCTKIQEKYHMCNFRCEPCQESFMGGGGYACFQCEHYHCVRCISKNQSVVKV